MKNELDIINTREIRTLCTARINEMTIDESGASGRNIEFELGEYPDFEVAYQRHAWQACVRAIAYRNNFYAERCRKAIRYAYKFQNINGSFGESNFFETVGFLEAHLHCDLLLDDMNQQTSEIGTDKILSAINWLNEKQKNVFNDDWIAFASSQDKANLVAGTASLFSLFARKFCRPDFFDIEKNLVETLLSDFQTCKGNFIEKNGYDSSYQTVTLQHLLFVYLYSKNPILKQKIDKSLDLGWQWELSRILSTGKILTDGNTRTGPTGAENKEVNYPEVIEALIYWGYASEQPIVLQTARKVWEYFQLALREV